MGGIWMFMCAVGACFVRLFGKELDGAQLNHARYGVVGDDLSKRLGAITRLTDKQRPWLESLRHRDNDLSVKLGGLLAYAALIIAALLLQLSAEPSTAVAIHRPCVIRLAALLVLALFVVAFLCLIGIAGGRSSYSGQADEALDQYLLVVRQKAILAKGAIVMAMACSAIAAAIFAFVTFG